MFELTDEASGTSYPARLYVSANSEEVLLTVEAIADLEGALICLSPEQTQQLIDELQRLLKEIKNNG